jgi:hypothetical protein
MLSIDRFEKNIEMGIPITPEKLQSRQFPVIQLDEYQGKDFVCGCGETRVFDAYSRDGTPAFVDLHLFKVGVLVKKCHCLCVLKLKRLFSNRIKTLYSSKLDRRAERFGFQGVYLPGEAFDEIINEYL